jgi:O-antigen ligase
MTGIWFMLCFGLLIFFLSSLLSNDKVQKRVIFVVVLSTAIYSILDLLGMDGLGLIWKKNISDALTFGNSTFAGMYIFGAFILSLYYLFSADIRRWWMYTLPFIIIVNPNILDINFLKGDFSQGIIGKAQASSYVIIASILLLFIIWLISRIKDGRIRRIISYSVFLFSILAVTVLSLSLILPGGRLQEFYLSQSSAARPVVWEIANHAIADRPFLGWGLDNFERVFERYYENRLLQDKYGNEPWFDRAHNVSIDQLVDSGVLGLVSYILVYIVIIWSLIYISLNTKRRKDAILSSLLIVYFSLHFAELQTAFDTTISYTIILLMLSLAISLWWRYTKDNNSELLMFNLHLNSILRLIIVIILFIFTVFSFCFGVYPYLRAQIANGEIRSVGQSEKRLLLYPALFGSRIDLHSFIWRTSTDFQVGISKDPTVLNNPQKVESLRKELLIFENELKDYLSENPDNFRAHLNLADILIYQRLFEVNKLNDAQAILDDAIKIVPQSPQPYWMKAVAYLYMRRFDLAREYARKGLNQNPDVVQSQRVVEYIESSIKTFPEIDLFFFKYI